MGYSIDELEGKISKLKTDFDVQSSKILQALDKAVNDLQEVGLPITIELNASPSNQSFALSTGNGFYNNVIGYSSGKIHIDNQLTLSIGINRNGDPKKGEDKEYSLFVSSFNVGHDAKDLDPIKANKFPILTEDGVKKFQDYMIEKYGRVKILKELDRFGNLNNSKFLQSKNKTIEDISDPKADKTAFPKAVLSKAPKS